MEKFTQYQGLVAPLDRENVDTDAIIPKQFLKSIKKTGFGRKLKQPKVSIENNQLNVDCKSEAEKLFATWKNTFVKSYKEKSIPIITNDLTWFQKTQIYIGRISIVLGIIYLLLLMYTKNI